jgi:hypothetical protein
VAACVLVGVAVGPSVGLLVAVVVAVGLLVAVAVASLGSVGVAVGGCCVAVGVAAGELESSSLPQAVNTVNDKASRTVKTRWQM